MKSKRAPVGQYIIENLGEMDNAYEYVEDLMPLIGEVVLFFNALESDLDDDICKTISDRSDQKGLLVLHNMMYATKVDLFQRFNSDFQRTFGWDIPGYHDLIASLKECGNLRNRVVHANWQYTDDDGFTQVRIRMSKDGLEHELWQFSIESMLEIIKKINQTRDALDEYIQECEVRMTMRNNEIFEHRKKNSDE